MIQSPEVLDLIAALEADIAILDGEALRREAKKSKQVASSGARRKA